MLGFFPCCERLSTSQHAVERWMLGEMMDEHVSTTARQSRLFDVLSSELGGKLPVQFIKRCERIEHFPMARGVRTTANDDVRAVRAMLTGRVSERFGVIQCFVQGGVEIARLRWRQHVSRPRQFEMNPVFFTFDRPFGRLL